MMKRGREGGNEKRCFRDNSKNGKRCVVYSISGAMMGE